MVYINEDEGLQDIASLHRKEEEDLAKVLADKYDVQYIDLTGFSIDSNALILIEEEVAREKEMAAFYKVGKKLHIASRAPAKEAVRAELERLHNEGFEIVEYIASRASLEKAWKLYSEITYASESEEGLLDVSTKEIEQFAEETHSKEDAVSRIQEIMSSADTRRTSQIIEIIIASALSLGASDIHIEPEEHAVGIRMRLDGVLSHLLDIDTQTYERLRSRIKLLSGIKINIEDEAQDGRFTINVHENDIEVRSSTLPGAYGESIVMRLLDPQTITLELVDLGMRSNVAEMVERELKKPNGMILNTGPTGSGKTTTLYTFLRKVHQPGIKIVTIEDPIEYHLDDIVQTQVDREGHYTFSSGLKSVLRQDPDVIMVGEIRDSETAETAIHAALTGHLVFSTLHTNTAAGTFPRLIDLGANSDILGSAINFTMAQRLVRKLCNVCTEQTPITPEEEQKIAHIIETMSNSDVKQGVTIPATLPRARGCEQCGNSGYQSRIGIFEVIVIDGPIEDLIRSRASDRKIESYAREHQSYLNMREDGVVKVLEGITTLEELERVIDLD